MRELSLHILDLVENSLRAQATTIVVMVEARPADDRLRIVIEDDGTGLRIAPEQVLNPFYTTKRGKRTGLGLSLFKAAAEATGGSLKLSPSRLGTAERPGLAVEVEMGLRHVDRNPLGDLGGTLSSVVCTNPEIDWRFSLKLGGRGCELRVADLVRELGVADAGDLAVAQAVMSRINTQLAECGVLT